ncbi:MAG: hypothetical protein KAT04_15000 [Methylococcales bacterium]|nr:hypothetical protein [Methylococcales bacterium]
MANIKEEPDKFDIPGEWSDHFDATIKSESTRAKVILSACYLDELLGQLLKIALKPCDNKSDPLFEGAQAPLSTFSARIELAHRMGAIPEETQKSLNYIRKIRNKFAHKITECDFNDSQIQNWNKELHSLNDVAEEKRRAGFSEGLIGDFEKSVSWLVFYLKTLIQQVPSECPNCGTEMEHRSKIKNATPEKNN